MESLVFFAANKGSQRKNNSQAVVRVFSSITLKLKISILRFNTYSTVTENCKKLRGTFPPKKDSIIQNDNRQVTILSDLSFLPLLLKSNENNSTLENSICSFTAKKENIIWRVGSDYTKKYKTKLNYEYISIYI